MLYKLNYASYLLIKGHTARSSDRGGSTFRVGNKQARQATALCLSCLRIDTRGRLSCLLEGLKSLCLLACLQAACHSAYTKSWHSVVVHPPPNPSISSSNVSNVAFSRCVTSSVFSYDWCEGKGGLGGGQKVLICL